MKTTYIFIVIVIYFIRVVHNQIIIKPAESIISRDQYKPFSALCTGQENIRIVSWQSPSLIDIEEKRNARISVERKTYGLRLRIRNLTQDDQGTWKCLGFNQDGKSFSDTLQIDVKVPITFVSEAIQYAEFNSTILIKCQVIANPSAEISWYKGQEKSNLLPLGYQQRDDGLRINRVSVKDNDTFWCQADVIETGESKDYQIQVILAEPITSTRITCMTPCAVEKRTATLICEANGMPSPQFAWFYGQESRPLIGDGMSKFVVRENRLIINYVDETDNGRYSCHAFNDYDQKGRRAEYILNVIIPLHLSSIPSMKVSIDENLPSQRVTFSCRVQRGSSANLSLEWLYPNNTVVQPVDGISIDTSQLMTNRLTELSFDPVRRQHYGNYTCLGKNLGDRTWTIAHLIVRYKPVFLHPKITHIYSVPNYQIMMICQFDSSPPPVFQWVKIFPEHDASQLILDDNHPQVINISTKQIGSTIYETQLVYKPLEEDFGFKFQCQANNSRMEKHSLTLRLAKPPASARILAVKPTSNAIELDVQPPFDFGGLPLTRYIVKYEQTDVQNSVKTDFFTVVSNESQIIKIESLDVASLYRIQIAVESPAGQSVFSIPVQTKTFKGNVPEFNLTDISCVNNRSYLLQWSIDYNGSSAISKAEISYAKVHDINRIGKWSKPILIDPEASEYEFKELKSSTQYIITVRLFNKAGHNERQIRKTIECKIHGRRSSNIWIITGIIALIITGTIIMLILFVLNRTRCDCNAHGNSS